MLSWDDWYHEQLEKNGTVDIASELSSYKKETEAFYDDWKEAVEKGKFNAFDSDGSLITEDD